MAEYTSTRAGFEQVMKRCLEGSPEEMRAFADATTTLSFHHTMNGQRVEREAWLKANGEWKDRIQEYIPKVHEFLRDGNQLAARMTGTCKLDGQDTFFESFLFAQIDEETSKMDSLIERSVWGTPGQAPEHGTV